MNAGEMADSSAQATILAMRVGHEIGLDARHPGPEWAKASPISFCTDWQGQHPDPARETEVRALWTPMYFYLRFVCRYRELCLFEDSDANGRRNHLWDRDVAEAFLQPNPAQQFYYKEFEVSPNGMWVDLDIGPRNISRQEPPRDLQSGLTRSACLDEERRTWAAELAIPMSALTRNFDPTIVWRANFFRAEGARETRFYSAWQPTKTAQPDFHVPGAFGYLRFS